MTSESSKLKIDRHPRPLTAEKLGSQLNNHRTAEGNRDHMLIKIVRDLKHIFGQKIPDQFVGTSPYGSRTKGYSLPTGPHRSDYEMLITYDILSERGEAHSRSVMYEKLKKLVNKYRKDCKIKPEINFLPINVNPSVILDNLRIQDYSEVALALRAVFGKSAGNVARIEDYRARIGQKIIRVVPDKSQRTILLNCICDYIVEWELHPVSVDKLISRIPGLERKQVDSAWVAREALWKKRLSKYLLDPVPLIES